MRVASIKPSPENSELYHPVNDDDPDVVALAESIRKHGVREPLVVSADRFILSGHRRHTAVGLIGQVIGQVIVPVRMLRNVSREKNRDKFLELLREFNRQRVKSHDEMLREEAVSVDPEEAYRVLREHRQANGFALTSVIRERSNKV